ncbi:MAG: sel1 repeat family protein [Bacteroidales bacterium]|nr:sel1 repeat family protein [Bacteroidales bacterium]
MKNKMLVVILLLLIMVSQVFAGNAVENLIKAAESGDRKAQKELGCRYRDGNGVSKDYQKAYMWLNKATIQGDIYAQDDLYKMCYWEAMQGNALAQLHMGDIFYDGRGFIHKEFLVSYIFYNIVAANKKNKRKINVKTKLSNLREKMKSNEVELAQESSKDIYKLIYGENGEKNGTRENAILIDILCPDKTSAEIELAHEKNKDLFRIIYDKNEKNGTFENAINKKYNNRSLDILIKAAESGDVEAQKELGIRYRDGNGVSKDEYNARQWFEKAAFQGDVQAQCYLSEAEYNAKGAYKSIVLSYVYCNIAAASNNEKLKIEEIRDKLQKIMLPREIDKAQQLSLNYFQRISEKIKNNDDTLEAALNKEFANGTVENLMKAARGGNIKAQKELGIKFYNDNNFPQAIIWFNKALRQGDFSVLSYLGDMYYYGKGVPRSYMMAYAFYKVAAANNGEKLKINEIKDKLLNKMTFNQIVEANSLSLHLFALIKNTKIK